MKERGFSKQERICNRDDFELLLSDGASFFSYPFNCLYCFKKTPDFSARIAISVSKKKIKLATSRNRIKRKIRESYRLEKHSLYKQFQNLPIGVDMLIIYVEKKQLGYNLIKKGLRVLIKKMSDAVHTSYSSLDSSEIG